MTVEKKAALQIIDTCLRMNSIGINQGTSGNVSARVRDAKGEAIAITPSGIDYEDLTPEKICQIYLHKDQEPVIDNNGYLPSTEWRFHYDIMLHRTDVNAIVHTHSIHATALACLGIPIPSFHYMVAKTGGSSIKIADYATFGTQELSNNALQALGNTLACLLKNHGVIACGKSLQQALRVAQEVETLAEMYLKILSVNPIYGKAQLLSEQEMQIVMEKFKTYGVQPIRKNQDG
ncbi:class II aldolase/adducin family protein [Lyngbya aestuarii]|uniref:class II aldolase/adducin family protein n=1 Tax=Lyngbya aestuarii TaxID=118322 RepID=UPI00403D70EC